MFIQASDCRLKRHIFLWFRTFHDAITKWQRLNLNQRLRRTGIVNLEDIINKYIRKPINSNPNSLHVTENDQEEIH